MIPELGHFALILALAVAVVQSSLPAIGAARQSDSLMAVAGTAAVAQLMLVGTAFVSLMHACVVSDSIGSAASRARGCAYVSLTVVAATITKKQPTPYITPDASQT